VGGPSPGTVVLFLGSDPALAERLAARPATYAWMARFFVPPNLLLDRAARATSASTDEPGPFPSDQVMCAQTVVDCARKNGRSLQLVDVNRPGEARELVQRYVTSQDVLPILVRADGARLVGAESFDVRTVRTFLAGS